MGQAKDGRVLPARSCSSTVASAFACVSAREDLSHWFLRAGSYFVLYIAVRDSDLEGGRSPWLELLSLMLSHA